MGSVSAPFEVNRRFAIDVGGRIRPFEGLLWGSGMKAEIFHSRLYPTSSHFETNVNMLVI